MNFSRRICAVVVAAPAIFLPACDSGRSEQLSTALAKKLHSERPAEVDLATLTAIPWDELFVFDPYSKREDNCQVLKLDLFSCRTTFPAVVGEGDNVLVFRRNAKVMRAEVHPRANGDFTVSTGGSRPQPIQRAAARFTVVPVAKAAPAEPPRFRLEYKG